jgi:hypothetical protein
MILSRMQRFGAPTGSVENQQLMFGENGLRNNGAHTARANEPQNYCDHVDYTTRAGRIIRMHKAAVTRSEDRRLGARFRPRFRIRT